MERALTAWRPGVVLSVLWPFETSRTCRASPPLAFSTSKDAEMMSAVTWARPGARSLAPFRQNHRRRTRLHISAQETQEPAFSRVKAKWAELREKANEDLVTVIRGSGVSLERETSWSLTAAGSSAFAEVVAVSFPGDSSREYHAGYDGNSSVWQDDMSGFATLLESEDCDKNVLATWLRTGQVMSA